MPPPSWLLASGVAAAACVAVFIALLRDGARPPCRVSQSEVVEGRAPDAPHGQGRYTLPALNPNELDAQNLQYKRWSFVSAANDRFLIATAQAKFTYIADTFLYVVDRRSKIVYEYEGRLPLGLGMEMSSSSVKGCAAWGVPKENGTRPWIEFCGSEHGGYRIRASLPMAITSLATGKKTDSTARIRMDVTFKWNQEDLVFLYPLGGDQNRLAYVHKAAGMAVDASQKAYLHIEQGSMKEEHSLISANGAIDWTKGRMFYRTFWRWVSFNEPKARVSRTTIGSEEPGTTKDERFGINLSDEVYDAKNEEGDVVSYENAVWINGQTFALERPIEIKVPEGDLRSKVWHIRSLKPTEDEDVDLTFQPWGARADYTNFGAVLSDFTQPYGVFKGRILLKRGNERLRVNIDESIGVVETHKAFW